MTRARKFDFEEAKRLFESGLTKKEIAFKMEIGYSYLRRVFFEAAGGSLKKPMPATSDIITLLETGMKQYKVGLELGCSREYVRKIINTIPESERTWLAPKKIIVTKRPHKKQKGVVQARYKPRPEVFESSFTSDKVRDAYAALGFGALATKFLERVE
jgi:hypothetical protein